MKEREKDILEIAHAIIREEGTLKLTVALQGELNFCHPCSRQPNTPTDMVTKVKLKH